MIKRHAVTIGIVLAVILLWWATRLYPGGNISDPTAVGFDWTKNFFSNLFNEKAMNGVENPGRIWADLGMMIHAASFAFFFYRFSARIPVPHAASMIKYFGIIGMIFTFLIVTPLHDLMVTVSGTIFLLTLFYITVFILKTKLHFLKILCLTSMLLFYFTMYLYGAGDWGLLAIMQKIVFATTIILVVSLDYGAHASSFAHIKPKRAMVKVQE